MGHAAVNLLNNGYTRLESGGKMKSFLARSTEYASVLEKIEAQRVSILLSCEALYFKAFL